MALWKTCTTCRVKKSLDDFYKDKTQPKGYRCSCKVCVLRIRTETRRNWSPEEKERNYALVRKWGVKNKERKASYAKNYNAANREKLRAAARVYSKQHSEEHKAWKKAHPQWTRAYANKRRAERIKAVPKWANKFFIDEAYDLAARRSAIKCGGVAKWHVDHIVPLKHKLVCGLHTHDNLQVIPAAENFSKNNRYWPDMPENNDG